MTKSLMILAAGALVLGFGRDARAEDADGGGSAAPGAAVAETADSASDKEEPLTALERFEGTNVTWHTGMSAYTAKRDAQPNYDPTVEMSGSLLLRFRFDPIFYTSAGVSVSRELTSQNDVDAEISGTTRNTDAAVSDVSLRFGASRFYTIPKAELALSADLGLTLPSSRVSRARSLVIGFGPGLSISRSFDVLSGIRLGYSGRFTSLQHRYSTPAVDDSRIQDAPGSASETSEYRNVSRRNVRWSTTHTVSFSIAFLDELSFDASGGYIYNRLYPAADTGFDIAETPEDNARRVATYDLSLTGTPVDWLNLTLGTSTASAPRKADQDLRTPFFTRYSDVYFDVTVDPIALAQSL